MDDTRLKDLDTDYFDELLARIRDIRSSDKKFYKKELYIYATNVDYERRSFMAVIEPSAAGAAIRRENGDFWWSTAVVAILCAPDQCEISIHKAHPYAAYGSQAS